MTRRSVRIVLSSAILLALGAARSRAAEFRGVLTSDDFNPRAVRIQRIDAKTIEFTVDADGQRGSLPIERVVRIERAGTAAAKPPADAFMFFLRDGQHWIGTPGEMKGDDLEFRSGKASRAIPLKQLDAVVSLRTGPATQPRGASRAQDELALTNGDVVSGVVSAATPTAITCTSSDGQATSIDWTNVRVVRFAVSGDVTSAAPPAIRATLRDGSVIDAASLKFADDSSVTIATDGQPARSISPNDIISLENRAGRARLLADIAPAESHWAPYFPRATAADTNAIPVAGRVSATVGGYSARACILARPRSTMRWSLDGSSKFFRTRYGIPESRAMADVTVRVKLDDKVVHERQHVRAGAVADLLNIELGGAKSLTLEVDYGDNYDVQDEFYWIEPALLPE